MRELDLFSKKTLGQAFAATVIAGLLVVSLLGPGRQGIDLSILMEPEGTAVWKSLTDDFQSRHPNVRIRLVEGPPATNTREISTLVKSGKYVERPA